MDMETEYKQSEKQNRAIIASLFLSFGWVVLLFGWISKRTDIGNELGLLSIVMFVISAVLFYRNIKGSRIRLPKVIGWTKWNDSLARFEDDSDGAIQYANAEQAIINEIRRRKYKFGGFYHQYGDAGCPVMDNHTAFLASMRQWGDIMARVWGGDYCEYAWDNNIGKTPKPCKDELVRHLTKEEKDARDANRRKEAESFRDEMLKKQEAQQSRINEINEEIMYNIEGLLMSVVNGFFGWGKSQSEMSKEQKECFEDLAGRLFNAFNWFDADNAKFGNTIVTLEQKERFSNGLNKTLEKIDTTGLIPELKRFKELFSIDN